MPDMNTGYSDKTSARIEAKPRLQVMIAMRITWHLRDMCESGVIDELAKHFDLSFLCSRNRDQSEYDLAKYGTVHFTEDAESGSTSWLQRLGRWRRADLNNIGYALLQVHARKEQEEFDFLINRTVVGWWYFPRLAVYILAYAGLGFLAGHLLRLWLRLTVSEMIPSSSKPDVILAMANPFTVNGHGDDLIRRARTRGIPLFAQQQNWDNIADRHFFETPDFLGVFGEQSFILAKCLHLFPTHRMFVTGSPRFELLRRPLPDRAEARARLGLPAKGPILLYCTPARDFDHRAVMEMIGKGMADGRLPSDLHILFKPHGGKPKAGPQNNDTVWSGDLVKDFPFVTVYGINAVDATTPLTAYPEMYAACDALISPYSTMVLEGEIVGRPALCLAYNDAGHPSNALKLDWERISYRMHLYPLRHSDGIVVCDRKQDFIQCCEDLLKLSNAADVQELTRKNAEVAVVTGNKSCAERITNALWTIHDKGAADGSEMMLPTGGFFRRLWVKWMHDETKDRQSI